MRIVITGATGFIGQPLVGAMAAAGHEVVVLARDPTKAGKVPGVSRAWAWTGAGTPLPAAALDEADAVVNLMGESINARMTEGHKRRVYESRVLATRQIVEAMGAAAAGPRILVSASAVGYYGDRGDEVLTEASAPGEGFLARLCVDWEAEARRAEAFGAHVCRVRIGVVLGRGGGALKAMLPVFRVGLGGPLAGGHAWMPWIHLEDATRLLLHALRREGAPVYNATAPNPVTNAQFTRALGRAIHRPAIAPVPRFALKTALGRDLASVVLMSDRVLPKQAESDGFQFRFPALEPALRNILGAT